MKKRKRHGKAVKRGLVLCLVAVMAIGCVPFTANAEETGGETADYPFMDTSLSFEERAADLVSRLTLEEKISLLTARRAEGISGVPRLGMGFC